MRILMVCNSCKTSHNVLSNSGGGGESFVDIRGGGVVVQEIESSDFRSPELRLSSLLFSQSPSTCPH